MSVEIRHLNVGPWKENTYCIISNYEAWLVDPGDEFDLLKQKFEVDKLDIKGIINTHGHFDHIGAVYEFQEESNLPFYIHSKDKRILIQASLYCKLAGSDKIIKTPEIHGFIDNFEKFDLANKSIFIHHTPGHSAGSVCFELENNLISGDLFFRDSIGRTDLPGGNAAVLKKSIEYIIKNFEGYNVYPGHGEPFVLDSSVISKLKKNL